MVTVPLSQLIERQIRIEPAEAIAIAQLLASAPGVPAIENIEIDSDGDARCRSTEGEPTVAALAAFLDRVLPRTGVPGGLRYAIARGLGAVEAPPLPHRLRSSRSRWCGSKAALATRSSVA